MNRYGLICRCISEQPAVTQRDMARELGVSLGTINTLVKGCLQQGFVIPSGVSGATYELTEAGMKFLETFRVDGALIIAAGFGSRFVPLTFETPKGLLEVFGERMIERQIKQLHEAGIRDITIAVGYLKEKFEYLIDKYNVKLLYNPEYSCKNTLATIYHARKVLEGRRMYLLSSDNWMRDNMYHAYECGAWYSSVHHTGETSEWVLSYNKKGLITGVHPGGRDAWVMYGPVFFSADFSNTFLPLLEAAYHTPGTEQFYWEHVYMQHVGELEMYINRRPENQVYEFENLEELRRFDPQYQHNSNNAAMRLVSEVFQVPESDVWDIRCLKAGMTNQSFLFQIDGKHYICRIPGRGTELLINREEEQAVYEAIRPLDLSEHILYLNGKNGYKIAEFYENSRNSDASSPEDVQRCMDCLRILHHSGLKVSHSFDIRERIVFYEKLCKAQGGILFEDYDLVREWMEHLLAHLETLNRPKVLAHIDSVADNFLFLPDGTVRLIDWEYSGMADPLIDIAMCAIYSFYDEEKTDWLLCTYLEREPSLQELIVTYSYVALGGFLWSLWAVYKSRLGDEFGEYTIIMYRYAKRYYRKILKLME